MLTIQEEMIAFITAIIAGMILRISYYCITRVRKIVKHSLLVIGIEDLIFWIASAIYIFVQIYYTSSGVIRWYFALGVVVGTLISTFFLQKFRKFVKKIYDFHHGKSIAKNEKKRYYN